jgi:hypothetical protein
MTTKCKEEMKSEHFACEIEEMKRLIVKTYLTAWGDDCYYNDYF